MIKINEVLALLYEGYEVQYDITKAGLIHWVKGKDCKNHLIHYNTFNALRMQGFIERLSCGARTLSFYTEIWKITDKGREIHEWRTRNKDR